MENSIRFGMVTVFAVSGSMVFLVHQVHKHLLNNFMKKFEFETRGYKKHQKKKKVRFAEDVLELPMKNNIAQINMTRTQQIDDKKFNLAIEDVNKWRHEQKLNDIMPPNRAILYREGMHAGDLPEMEPVHKKTPRVTEMEGFREWLKAVMTETLSGIHVGDSPEMEPDR
ncbi:hypothetical protein RIF29_17004 [Crotalaria pallida]|uniref:Uncharacterized protein n=1 Tax=Crotalaria pallida TaxID=3830 RepID=A0AAN9FND1_CROPI